MLTQTGWHLWSILAKGGIVMVPLMVSSIISLAVIIERCLFWRHLRTQEDGSSVLALVAAVICQIGVPRLSHSSAAP